MKASYVIKRILLTLFIFFVVVTLCFFIPRIGVDDPASRYYPAQTAGMTATMRRRTGAGTVAKTEFILELTCR